MSAGELLREWRQRRRLSQMRHLSFLENGRSRPSRELVLRLSERLEVPLRERNAILLAAGHAPHYPERALADPALETVRRAIDVVLRAHEPFPASPSTATGISPPPTAWSFFTGIDTALLRELAGYPAPPAPVSHEYAGVVIPLELRAGGDCTLRFFSTITVFGTPVDAGVAQTILSALRQTRVSVAHGFAVRRRSHCVGPRRAPSRRWPR